MLGFIYFGRSFVLSFMSYVFRSLYIYIYIYIYMCFIYIVSSFPLSFVMSFVFSLCMVRSFFICVSYLCSFFELYVFPSLFC